mmetsp:Transcript_55685/g.121240  ORF Transcript_55685/g.121240 Transcript_55685/m.121240 type:complete len:272 (+) Transcript_55685:115-930(+)
MIIAAAIVGVVDTRTSKEIDARVEATVAEARIKPCFRLHVGARAAFEWPLKTPARLVVVERAPLVVAPIAGRMQVQRRLLLAQRGRMRVPAEAIARIGWDHASRVVTVHVVTVQVVTVQVVRLVREIALLPTTAVQMPWCSAARRHPVSRARQPAACRLRSAASTRIRPRRRADCMLAPPRWRAPLHRLEALGRVEGHRRSCPRLEARGTAAAELCMPEYCTRAAVQSRLIRIASTEPPGIRVASRRSSSHECGIVGGSGTLPQFRLAANQ